MLAVVFLASCGSGGGGETVTKADFVRQGNAICGKWQQARTKLFSEITQKLKPPITQAKQEKAILLILQPYEDALQGLKELDPPAGDEAKVEEMIGAIENGVAQAHADPAAQISSGVAFNKSNRLLEDYGLKECMV